VFLTVLQLCLLWWLYRTRRIQLRDYRIWHACHEMVARRCQLAPNQDPEYTLTELHKLVGGVGGTHLRASLRRLEALGLLTWSRTRITFATSVEDLHGVEQLTDFHTMLAAVAQAPQRRVPVPRPTLRLIAGGCAIAMIATMLGHLLGGLNLLGGMDLAYRGFGQGLRGPGPAFLNQAGLFQLLRDGPQPIRRLRMLAGIVFEK